MNNIITPLKGPDRVRRRPAVIFGNDNAEGVKTAVEMLLSTLLEGGCTQIILTQFADNSLKIQDNGKGLYLGSPENSCWKDVFDQLYALSPWEAPGRSVFDVPTDDSPSDSMDLCALQYASAQMQVRAVRDGLGWDLQFHKGYLTGDYQVAPSDEPSGTMLHFLPDREVFSDIALDSQALAQALQIMALHQAGLTVIYRRETAAGFEESTYCYPQGAADYLQGPHIYTAGLSAEGRERYNRPQYHAQVRMGLCFVEDGGFVKCSHNLRQLPNGGTHCDALIAEIQKYLEWMLDLSLTEEQLRQHLQLVLITDSDFTSWSNGTRTAIDNILIRDMAQDTLGDNFRRFLKEHADALTAMLN